MAVDGLEQQLGEAAGRGSELGAIGKALDFDVEQEAATAGKSKDFIERRYARAGHGLLTGELGIDERTAVPRAKFAESELADDVAAAGVPADLEIQNGIVGDDENVVAGDVDVHLDSVGARVDGVLEGRQRVFREHGARAAVTVDLDRHRQRASACIEYQGVRRMDSMTRRDFVSGAALAGTMALGGGQAGASPKLPQLCLFSKHLPKLNYSELARTVKQIGFDGVDLTVRPEGHVLPGRVVEDLPRALETLRGAGLSVPMITTGLTSANDPAARPTIETAGRLGVPRFKLGYWNYRDQESIEARLADVRRDVAGLAALAK